MNRTFSLVAAQSAIAAAVLVAAPAFATSYDSFDPTAASITSSADRAEVRAGAVAAARNVQAGVAEEGRSVNAKSSFASTTSRAQVQSEAVAAVRNGELPGYEGRINGVADTAVRLAALGR